MQSIAFSYCKLLATIPQRQVDLEFCIWIHQFTKHFDRRLLVLESQRHAFCALVIGAFKILGSVKIRPSGSQIHLSFLVFLSELFRKLQKLGLTCSRNSLYKNALSIHIDLDADSVSSQQLEIFALFNRLVEVSKNTDVRSYRCYDVCIFCDTLYASLVKNIVYM